MDAADGDNGVEGPEPSREHRSSLPPEQEERIRAWPDPADADLRQRIETTVGHLGRKLVVPRTVSPPAPKIEVLGQAVLDEVRAGDRVLDMGTGSGINAILAASCVAPGAAPGSTTGVGRGGVVGVDRNPAAVACARGNAARNGVTATTAFRVSDLFDRVRGTFDVIVLDPPFRELTPGDALEEANTDAGHDPFTRFLGQARGFLRPGGRILALFGTSADPEDLHHLIDRFDFARQPIGERELDGDGWTVGPVVYRLTAGGSAPS